MPLLTQNSMEIRPTIKSVHRGYAPNYGNGMVGGEFYDCTALYYKLIWIEELTDDEAVQAWLSQRINDDSIKVEAYITDGYDRSCNCDIFEIDEVFEPEDFLKATEECSLLTPETKQTLWERLDNIAYDTDNYEPCE